MSRGEHSRGLQYGNFKAICGLDVIAHDTLSMSSSCSLIIACNRLPDTTKIKEWHSTAFTRRAIVIPMYYDVGIHVERFNIVKLEEKERLSL